jgi:hypothetical protein
MVFVHSTTISAPAATSLAASLASRSPAPAQLPSACNCSMRAKS